LRAAVDAGADAVEFDLQVARCGTPVLFHDETLERTTDGSGPVAEHDFDSLWELDAGSWFHPDFAGEPVPSFAQALDAFGARAGRLYPEIKRYGSLEDLDRMAALVREAGCTERTVFISMDWDALDHMTVALPAAHLGYIVEERARFEAALERIRDRPRCMLDFDARIVAAEPELVARTLDAGADVAVWTVNDPARAEALFRAGVRRFTTNEVELLMDWRTEREGAHEV
jgi:glycerophosphoryl diester phosphodiesterase